MVNSAAVLPLYTLDLLRRYWAPLLCTYAVGTFLHTMMMRGVVQLGLTHPLFGMLGVSLTLLVTLVVTILMFHILRPALPVLDQELARRGGGSQAVRGASLRDRERRLVDAVAMAILPFLIFYTAWGLIAEETREYAVGALNRGGVEGFVFVLSDFADQTMILFGVALAFLAVRVLVEYFYKRGGHPILGVLTAIFESCWIFFAAFSGVSFVSAVRNWFTGRVVWVEIREGFFSLIAGLENLLDLPAVAIVLAIGGALGAGWELIRDGLFEPVLWLTIAAVVFGAEVDRAESLFPNSRGARRLQRLAGRMPGSAARVAALMSKGITERYLPFLNALRLILRAGPLFYLAFCLYYVVLEVGFGWVERAVYIVVGPNDFHAWWWQWLGPVSFGVDAVHELLRICLLAAAFEVTLRRIGGRGVGRRARAEV
jgi:hypothetical protein